MCPTLQALADGETDPATVASLADQRLRATAAQLSDALSARTTLHPVYRRLLKLTLEELRLIEEHLSQLDQQMTDLLAEHHEAVQRLAEVPGLGVDSAQQIIAEVGATATFFASALTAGPRSSYRMIRRDSRPWLICAA